MKSLVKKLMSTMLVTAMGVSLVGCGSSDTGNSTPTPSQSADAGTPATSSNDVVEIEFWYAWTDKIQENNINLAEQFNATVGKEKGIKVTPVYQGTYDDVHQKLQASFIAKQPPALSIMEIASTKLFAENGIIQSIEPFIERDNLDVDDFYDGLVENCIVNGEYYGLPYLRSTPILYVNSTLLEEAGLDPAGPQTWDELAEFSRTINSELGINGLTMYSYDWVFESFFLQHGTSVLNADETATNLNSEEGKEIFTFFQDLVNDGAVKVYAGADSSKVMPDVMNQNTAMWFSSTGDLTNNLAVAAENGFEINTAFIPAAQTYGVPTGGGNIVMTKGLSPAEEEAAWEYMKWLTDTDQTVYASIYTGYVTVRESAIEDPQIQALFDSTPQAQVALNQLEDYGHGRPMHPRYAEVRKEFVNAMDAIWVNGGDVNTTLDEIAAKVNRILTE
ncbi:MAG: hypothetical protein ATN36_05440 [Epulopiscium sp. Nele67-Bin005]|nr:MAG: hypothetical protein ATN36_05440 [Epulopiscium sp. Nele67-Bin005]